MVLGLLLSDSELTANFVFAIYEFLYIGGTAGQLNPETFTFISDLQLQEVHPVNTAGTASFVLSYNISSLLVRKKFTANNPLEILMMIMAVNQFVSCGDGRHGQNC